MKSSNTVFSSYLKPSSLLLVACLIAQALMATLSSLRAQASSPNFDASAAIEASTTKEAATKAIVDANYGKLPLSFEVNRGQADQQVKFLARAGGSSLLLKSNEAVLTLLPEEQIKESVKTKPYRTFNEEPPRHITATIKMQLLGADPHPRIVGLDEQQAKSSYFVGNDPQRWTTDVPNYAKVKYEQVYPGIDLIFYGNPQQLEYDFVLAPGADLKRIKLSFAGVQQMKIEATGDLVLETKAGEVRQHKPVIYQEVKGERRAVSGSYALGKKGEVAFQVSAYDTRLPLVIDPVIAYATFFGNIPGAAIAVDAAGNAYVVGQVPATPGAFQGGSQLSVAKLNATGTALVYSATFSSHQDDRITDLAVDAAGNCYLTGRARSGSFPTTPGAFQASYGRPDGYNAIVAKLNAQGNALVYSTFLKGDTPFPTTEPKANFGEAIAVDAQGNAYVTGSTNATDFPTTPGAFQTMIATYPSSLGGIFPPADPFITKLNPTGTALVYSTFLGAANNVEEGKDIAVDKDGNAYVTGSTSNGYVDVRLPQGTPFPVIPGAYRTTDTYGSGGGFIVNYAFVTKLNGTGAALVYSTLLGSMHGSGDPLRIAVDSNGSAYVTGITLSNTFPTTPGAFRRILGGPGDAFVTKLNPAGSALAYSTFLGGDFGDDSYDIKVDAEGNAHVVGFTSSSDFPQIGLPPQIIGPGENSGGFVTKLNATGSAPIQSIFIKIGYVNAIALDNAGNAYVTGSGRIQPTPNAYQSNPSTGFVAKLTSPRSFLSVSAASYTADLAREAIVAAFGSGLTTTTQVATATPLPTMLAGTTVKVRDSAGTERNAPLFFISPTQINYLIPPGTATGMATITVNDNDGTLAATTVLISQIAPGLFTTNASGQGLAAAVALRVKADGSQSFEPIARFDPAQSRFIPIPIDLGPESEQVFLILYGTGIRFRSSLSAVSVRLGGVDAPVTYAGEQGNLVGLDQVNARLPRSLIGRGEVEVVLTAEGKTANAVRVSIK